MAMFRHTLLQSKEYSRRLLATRTAELSQHSPYKLKKTSPPRQETIGIPSTVLETTPDSSPFQKIPRESSTENEPQITKECLIKPEEIAQEIEGPVIKAKKSKKIRIATVLPSVQHNSSICSNLAPETQHGLYAKFCYKILAEYGFNLSTTDVHNSGVALSGKWYLPKKCVNVYGTCIHSNTANALSVKQKGGSHKNKQKDKSDGVNLIINNTGFQRVEGQDFTLSPQPTIICSIFDRGQNWLSLQQSDNATILLNKNLHRQIWNHNGVMINPNRWKLEKNTECPYNQLTQGISLLIVNKAFQEAFPEILVGRVVYQRAQDTSNRNKCPHYATSTFLLEDQTLKDERQCLATFTRNEKMQLALREEERLAELKVEEERRLELEEERRLELEEERRVELLEEIRLEALVEENRMAQEEFSSQEQEHTATGVYDKSPEHYIRIPELEDHPAGERWSMVKHRRRTFSVRTENKLDSVEMQTIDDVLNAAVAITSQDGLVSAKLNYTEEREFSHSIDDVLDAAVAITSQDGIVSAKLDSIVTIDDVLNVTSQDDQDYQAMVSYGLMDRDIRSVFQMQSRSYHSLAMTSLAEDMHVAVLDQDHKDDSVDHDLLRQERMLMIELLTNKCEMVESAESSQDNSAFDQPETASIFEDTAEALNEGTQGYVQGFVSLKDMLDAKHGISRSYESMVGSQQYSGPGCYDVDEIINGGKSSGTPYKLKKFLLQKFTDYNSYEAQHLAAARYCIAREPLHNQPVFIGSPQQPTSFTRPSNASFVKTKLTQLWGEPSVGLERDEHLQLRMR